MTGPTINEVPAYATTPKGPSLRQEFTFDGVHYVLRKPKSSIAMYMLSLAEGEDLHDRGQLSQDLLNLTRSIIGYIEEEPPNPDGSLRGQARLWQRLNDPRDDLDLEDLAAPFNDLIARVFGRPTKRSPASSRKRPAKSQGSKADTR